MAADKVRWIEIQVDIDVNINKKEKQIKNQIYKYR